MKKVYQVLWLGDTPPEGKLIWHGEVHSEASSRKKAQKIIADLCKKHKNAKDYEVILSIREVWKP